MTKPEQALVEVEQKLQDKRSAALTAQYSALEKAAKAHKCCWELERRLRLTMSCSGCCE